MRLSSFLYKSKKNIKEQLSFSVNRLLRGCFIAQENSGIYTMLPLGLKVLNKLIKVIEDEMNTIGIQVALPFLQSTDLWKKSGRYNSYGKEMLRLTDRNNQELILPPTCEEAIFNILQNISTSYKILPKTLYQITWKFRDELRPRSGLLRGRLFLMKDAYSFGETEEEALEHYRLHYNIYCKIFKKLNMEVYTIKADSGEIGGEMSHEFVVKSDEGDSAAYLYKQIEEINELKDINNQVGSYKKSNELLENKKYTSCKVMELGHIFYYDTKYSEKLNAKYITKENKEAYYYGGCYGIGVTRVLGILSMEKYWPMIVSPFQVHLIDIKNHIFAEEVYNFLRSNNIDVLYDDRMDSSYGEKMNDMELIGIPLRIIVGKNIECYFYDEKIEIIKDLETKNQILDYLRQKIQI